MRVIYKNITTLNQVITGSESSYHHWKMKLCDVENTTQTNPIKGAKKITTTITIKIVIKA